MAVEHLPQRGLLLVSGPSRGGKSRWAEHLVAGWSGGVLYLATGPGPSSDTTWNDRIEAHRRRRPAGWQCCEVAAGLVEQLQSIAASDLGAEAPCLLIDSLGTWLAWHLDEPEAQWQARCAALIAAIADQQGPVVVVVEETGWGVVPPTAIGGLFRDRLGALHQQLMASCEAAWLVVAGRALNLLELGIPVPHG